MATLPPNRPLLADILDSDYAVQVEEEKYDENGHLMSFVLHYITGHTVSISVSDPKTAHIDVKVISKEGSSR